MDVVQVCLPQGGQALDAFRSRVGTVEELSDGHLWPGSLSITLWTKEPSYKRSSTFDRVRRKPAAFGSVSLSSTSLFSLSSGPSNHTGLDIYWRTLQRPLAAPPSCSAHVHHLLLMAIWEGNLNDLLQFSPPLWCEVEEGGQAGHCSEHIFHHRDYIRIDNDDAETTRGTMK
ncbi:hypothetical protein PoB_004001600 [Plakobranchus ocellatus]|uniref:Uncharacterized protein n=1 Tax=Plakobranchus ocellatus TaxID=259542 RepID=A0AAV4AQT1_9GAST|nr:hypothetical protein PoB_004001600 [Plakobranchus ocellatus]